MHRSILIRFILVFIALSLLILTISAQGNNYNWHTVVVDSTAGNAVDTSLAVVNGQPAISYFDGELRYARFNGATWDVETVDNTTSTGSYTSLAVVDGQPAISYQDGDTGYLRYARFNGATWDKVTVDNAAVTGAYTSLAVVDGQPAISYQDNSQGHLRYARFNGATWDKVTVDNAANTGGYTSLAVVDGQPAISYHDGNTGDLRYAHFNGATWDKVTVDSAGTTGRFTSLAVVDGQPAISYFSLTNGDLRYARFNGATWDKVTVDSAGITGVFTSLAVVDSQPAISYFDNSQNDLRYARFNGATWDKETVDADGSTGRYGSLAVVKGHAAISYQDKDQYLSYTLRNAIPEAMDDAYTFEGNVVTGNAIANDTDADEVDVLSVVQLSNPTGGDLLLIESGSFVYLPDENFTGEDSFTYMVDDGIDTSNIATVTITLTTEPEIVANADSYYTPDDTRLTIPAPGVLMNDTIDTTDELTAIKVSDVSAGLVILNPNGSFTYSPDDGFVGTDSFTYVASNGSTESEPVTVSILVSDAGPAPVCPVIMGMTVTETMRNDPPEAPDYMCTVPNQGRPTIIWRNDPRADWYQVWIGGQDKLLLLDWFPKDSDELPEGEHVPGDSGAAIKAQCEGLTCTLQPDINPTAGTYQVWMQAWGTPTTDLADGQTAEGGPVVTAQGWNGGDNEPNSNFTLSSSPPGAIQPLTSTIGADGEVALTWQGAERATWYNVWIGTAPEEWQMAFFDWMLAKNLGCENGGICTLTAGVELAIGGEFDLKLTTPGDYIYYVQSWGPGGFSTGGTFDAWQESPVFTVP